MNQASCRFGSCTVLCALLYTLGTSICAGKNDISRSKFRGPPCHEGQGETYVAMHIAKPGRRMDPTNLLLLIHSLALSGTSRPLTIMYDSSVSGESVAIISWFCDHISILVRSGFNCGWENIESIAPYSSITQNLTSARKLGRVSIWAEIAKRNRAFEFLDYVYLAKMQILRLPCRRAIFLDDDLVIGANIDSLFDEASRLESYPKANSSRSWRLSMALCNAGLIIASPHTNQFIDFLHYTFENKIRINPDQSSTCPFFCKKKNCIKNVGPHAMNECSRPCPSGRQYFELSLEYHSTTHMCAAIPNLLRIQPRALHFIGGTKPSTLYNLSIYDRDLKWGAFPSDLEEKYIRDMLHWYYKTPKRKWRNPHVSQHDMVPCFSYFFRKWVSSYESVKRCLIPYFGLATN
jgi:hypothetical protein